MFDAYDVTLQMIRSLVKVVDVIEKRDPELADQIRRALSVLLNINEVRAGLDAAEAWGWVSVPEDARALLDRNAAMLWRLTHPRG
ncbi:MAG TPA: hypothetical protein VM261_30350 [Kofleriaceae bacterium]|nr:hypothetical protein [Kofleriaceae bacterium]